jgi:hypothetical protein
MNNLKELMIETLKEKGPFKISLYGSDLFDSVVCDIDHGSEFEDMFIDVEFDGEKVSYTYQGPYDSYEEDDNSNVETCELGELTILQLSMIIQNL